MPYDGEHVSAEQISRRKRHVRAFSKECLVAGSGVVESISHSRGLGVPVQDEREISGVLALVPFRAIEPCAEFGGCVAGDGRDPDC